MTDAPSALKKPEQNDEAPTPDIRSKLAPAELNGASPVPQSPGTTTKAALRNLTLPTVPNLDIPPSPPGSPPPTMNKKVAQFLELKKRDTHFNGKLARSSAMKNPSLLGKLITFAGLDFSDQYTTTLPTELWDPQGFPSWAYKDELAKAQQEAQKKRDEERVRVGRGAADFVAASGSEGQYNRSETPWGREIRGSAAERVMAGLSRDREPKGSSRGDNYRRRSRSPARRRYL